MRHLPPDPNGGRRWQPSPLAPSSQTAVPVRARSFHMGAASPVRRLCTFGVHCTCHEQVLPTHTAQQLPFNAFALILDSSFPPRRPHNNLYFLAINIFASSLSWLFISSNASWYPFSASAYCSFVACPAMNTILIASTDFS